jgi:hypothetical protein
MEAVETDKEVTAVAVGRVRRRNRHMGACEHTRSARTTSRPSGRSVWSLPIFG